MASERRVAALSHRGALLRTPMAHDFPRTAASASSYGASLIWISGASAPICSLHSAVPCGAKTRSSIAHAPWLKYRAGWRRRAISFKALSLAGNNREDSCSPLITWRIAHRGAGTRINIGSAQRSAAEHQRSARQQHHLAVSSPGAHSWRENSVLRSTMNAAITSSAHCALAPYRRYQCRRRRHRTLAPLHSFRRRKRSSLNML